MWMKNLNRPYLLFYGTCKANPGKARGGGILFESSGNNPITYEWGLEENSNNRAGAYGLLLGTTILKQRKMLNPIILGDSSIIIQAMVERSTPTNKALIQIIKRIRKKLINMGKVSFKHILRENNKIADIQANRAVTQSPGESRTSHDIVQIPIP